MANLSDTLIENLADPDTKPSLLPLAFRRGDNSRRIYHCKNALQKAINICISEQQKEQLILFYEKGLSKSQIANHQKTGCSAVTKSMKACLNQLSQYINMYMEIYDCLENEFINSDN